MRFVTSFVISRLTADDSIIVVGAGHHALSVLGVVADVGCPVAGLVADGNEPGTKFAGAKVLGGLSTAAELCTRIPAAKWVMAIGDNYHRLRIMREIQGLCPQAQFAPLVHPSCVIAPDVILDEGSVVMPGAVVMAASRLRAASLVNTQASLDHESSLDEGASLAPGVVTAGNVKVGRRSFVGIGATIVQGITIGSDSVIGAGSLLLHNVPDNTVAYGRPARNIRAREVDEPYL